MMQRLAVDTSGWRRHPHVWIALLLIAALGWIVSIQQASSMAGMSQHSGEMGGMAGSHTSAVVSLPVWVAMMAAMMFPAIAPVVSLFGAVGRKKRRDGNNAVPTLIFVAGYLVVWSLFGVGAYLLSLAVPSVDMVAPGIKSRSLVAAGLVLAAAGLCEWSPLKAACLRHCRSPLGTFLSLWRDGWAGALRMGIVHGAYCLGCCWGLMLVLFAVGLMNLTAMVLLTVLIFAQKALPYGDLIGKAAGLVLLTTGLAFVLAPVV